MGQNHGSFGSKVWHFWIVTHRVTKSISWDKKIELSQQESCVNSSPYTKLTRQRCRVNSKPCTELRQIFNCSHNLSQLLKIPRFGIIEGLSLKLLRDLHFFLESFYFFFNRIVHYAQSKESRNLLKKIPKITCKAIFRNSLKN